MMQRFLVGGAVRDRLLGLPPRERDWLIIGSDPERLGAAGYRPVGAAFTVFLDPDTGEECALPRGRTAPDASIREQVEADLRRRDLTINAIAQDTDGHLIDPLNGQADLAARLLRHTPAFAEDPLRVLRLARLQARLHHLGFRVAGQTRALVRSMARRGDLARLVPERVWGELVKALQDPQPQRFIANLRDWQALAPLLPELDRLFGVPQPPRHHPEIDTGLHSLLSLERACELSPLPEVRLAALLHDLGKGTTPRSQWPRHIGHEQRGARLADALCRRLRAPQRFRRLAVAGARFHTDCHRAFELRPTTLLRLLLRLDGLRRPEALDHFTSVCPADLRGRPGQERTPYPQAAFLQQINDALRAIDHRRLLQGVPPEQIPKRLERARLQQIRRAREQFQPPA